MTTSVASKPREKYDVEVTRRFDKEYLKLPRDVRLRISEKIDELKIDPRAHKSLHGALGGLFSMRVSTYRVLYAIDERGNRVILISAKHRKHVY